MKFIPLKDQIDTENDDFFLVEHTIEKIDGYIPYTIGTDLMKQMILYRRLEYRMNPAEITMCIIATKDAGIRRFDWDGIMRNYDGYQAFRSYSSVSYAVDGIRRQECVVAAYRGEMRDWLLEDIRRNGSGMRMLCMQNQYDEFLTLFGYKPLFLEAIQKFDHDKSFL
jgi:hypothetical protein|nr:MAG TPA: hypothetical protein [Caudoviricetes sp.]